MTATGAIPPIPAAKSSYAFSCMLDKPGPTSAGIFNSEGRLVRVLWTTKTAEAGLLKGKWNGKDNDGALAPPGEYLEGGRQSIEV